MTSGGCVYMLNRRSNQENLLQYHKAVSCHPAIGDTVVKVTPKCPSVQDKV